MTYKLEFYLREWLQTLSLELFLIVYEHQRLVLKPILNLQLFSLKDGSFCEKELELSEIATTVEKNYTRGSRLKVFATFLCYKVEIVT